MRRKTLRVQTDAICLQLVESTDMEPMDAEQLYFVTAVMVCCVGRDVMLGIYQTLLKLG